MVLREFARSVLPGLVRREWYSPFVPAMEKRHPFAVRAVPVMYATKLTYQAKLRATRQTLPQAKSLGRLKLLANPVGQSLQRRVEEWVIPPPLALRARPQEDSHCQSTTAIPLVWVRVHQCLRGPGPFAFFREIPAGQKCNRAERCGECPTSARYRQRCSRRGLVGYGNRRSRLLRKRARPA
jgi:hypothetical protein